jgi:hypothetical protein
MNVRGADNPPQNESKKRGGKIKQMEKPNTNTSKYKKKHSLAFCRGNYNVQSNKTTTPKPHNPASRSAPNFQRPSGFPTPPYNAAADHTPASFFSKNYTKERNT